MEFRFPRARRLARQEEIDRVYRKGARIGGRFLRLHVRPNGLELSRLAISASSRVCNAVERNRWKRLLREVFRLRSSEIGPGLDLVAVPTRPPKEIRRQEVEPIFLELIRRARREIPS